MTAATAAETVHTAAQGKGIIATKAATIAQVFLTQSQKQIHTSYFATALITVVGALAAFAIGNSAAKEKQRRWTMKFREERKIWKIWIFNIKEELKDLRRMEQHKKQF